MHDVHCFSSSVFVCRVKHTQCKSLSSWTLVKQFKSCFNFKCMDCLSVIKHESANLLYNGPESKCLRFILWGKISCSQPTLLCACSSVEAFRDRVRETVLSSSIQSLGRASASSLSFSSRGRSATPGPQLALC